MISKTLALACLVFVFAAPAYARLAPGEQPGPYADWWTCMSRTLPSGALTICCTVSDGHILSDDDWRLSPADKNGQRHYQFRIRDTDLNGKPYTTRWFDIPDGQVIKPSSCSRFPQPEPSAAKVWYTPTRDVNGVITSLDSWCFRPGTEY